MGEVSSFTENNPAVNITELLVCMALSSLLLGVSTKLAIQINQYVQNKLKLTQERNEVLHALSIIARTIRQSGFPEASTKFPKLSSKQSFVIEQSIKVGKSSSLNISPIGTFNFRKGINNVNQSDALSIKHASQAQFNCLGHRITAKRLIKGYSHQGFFMQRMDGEHSKTGMLMCQTINNHGQAQNDGILNGVEKLNFHLSPNTTSPEGVLVNLKMQSGHEYSRFIAIRHVGRSN